MKVIERRKQIKTELQKSNLPIKGQELAAMFGVSRQVIVQDIAVLKAEGIQIIATPNGYIIPKIGTNKLIKSVAVKHFEEQLEEELYIMVDNNAKIIDVVVEHPIYGEMKGNLNISSRSDVDGFIEKIKKEAIPISSLTDGVHIHNIEVEKESDYENIVRELNKREILLD